MDQVAVLYFFFPLEKKKKEKLMVYKIPQD